MGFLLHAILEIAYVILLALLVAGIALDVTASIRSWRRLRRDPSRIADLRGAWYRSRVYNAWLQHCPLCVVWPTHDVIATMRRRLRRRRARERFVLWGHRRHMVQIGSRTDHRIQRRIMKQTRLVRSMRRITVAGVRGSESVRKLGEALNAMFVGMGKTNPAPAVQALNSIGREADRAFKGNDGITFGQAKVYVAPVGTPFPPVNDEPSAPWRYLGEARSPHRP